MNRRTVRWSMLVVTTGALAASVANCAATESNELVESSGSLSAAGGSGVGGFDGTGGGDNALCKVPADTDDGVVPSCDDIAPPDAFAPVIQWQWTGPLPRHSFRAGSYTTPLVGNITDDNGDGAIDLCDTPDVIISVIDHYLISGGPITVSLEGTLYLLSGDTGEDHFAFQAPIDGLVTPAFADIDDDGMPEVLAADFDGHLIAFEHDGTVKWTSASVAGYRSHYSAAQCPTIAVYDLEGDGAVEIILGFEVYDAQGTRLWGVVGNAQEFDGQYWCVTPTAADLDGDGNLEVLFGHQTYHHDGQLYWTTNGEPPSHPHVANLDADADPEVFLTNANGLMVVEHDGTLKFGPLRHRAEPAPHCWGKPAVVHDFDGDGAADIAASTCGDYTTYAVGPTDLSMVWSNGVSDASGLATATAFDFLGDATSEAIYADEDNLFVFDGLSGDIALTAPRNSGTLIEYPVVADVDNDGSAEILYVSNYPDVNGPTITALRDAQDRWIPARRIWNQYSYHVTNVREDGTIPRQMKKSWLNLNTFRTNAQISTLGDCSPPL